MSALASKLKTLNTQDIIDIMISHSDGSIDLSGCDLSDVNFDKVKQELQRAGKQVSRYDLDLSGVDLTGSQLIGVDLSHTKLTGAVMIDCDITDANLFNCSMYKADLTNAIADDCVLSNAYLREAKLDGVSLVGGQLGGCDMAYASLVEADLRGANINGINLKFANTTDALLPQRVIRLQGFAPHKYDVTIIGQYIEVLFKVKPISYWEALTIEDIAACEFWDDYDGELQAFWTDYRDHILMMAKVNKE